MKFVSKYKFHFIWLGTAAVTLIVFYFCNINANFLGIVETRTHKLGALESGRISQMYVGLGNEVKANQVLAVLDIKDLEMEQENLLQERQRMDAMMEADQERYSLEYEKIRLQRNSDQAALAAKKGELAALNEEIDRLEEAEKNGLGRPRELSDLLIRRESVRRYVENSGTPLAASSPDRRFRLPKTGNAEHVVMSMLDERMERINNLNLQIGILSERMAHRKVVSPCDGRVVNVNYLPGDAVERFATIFTVEEPTAVFLDVFIPESSNKEPRLGQRVSIHPHRLGASNSGGTIVFIDPGYSAIPDRLAFRKIIYWARKFRVKIDEGHSLRPGESVEVTLLGDIDPLHAAKADDSPGPKIFQTEVIKKPDHPLREISLDEKLHHLTRFEPSGIAWLPDIKRYLIVSDDTSRSTPEHAPWIFLMDESGKVDPEVVTVSGIEALNDVESISVSPDGTLYFVSSQAVSKKGKRPASRQQILKIARSGRSFKVVGSVDFFELLTRAFSKEQLASLGLPRTQDNRIALNIEASVWYGGDLLLGLKEPRPEKGAILWRLRQPDKLFESSKIEPDQLTVLAFVDLKTPDGRAAGFSDLAVDDHHRLFALATVPGADDAAQVSGFYLLLPEGKGFKPVTLANFPALKAEGLCPRGDGRFTVVFDTDDKAPFYYQLVESPKP